jgi:hypothetical protein
MGYRPSVRFNTRLVLSSAEIYTQADIKPGMVFKMGDGGLLVIESIQMREHVNGSNPLKPVIRKRHMVYSRLYKNRSRKICATQVSNLYNRVVTEVIIA